MKTKTVTEALAALEEASKAFWDSFDHEPLPYNISDETDKCWRVDGFEYQWWDEGAVPDDGWSGEIYGTSVWTNETHTVAVLNNGSGDRDAYVFLNSRRLQGGFF